MMNIKNILMVCSIVSMVMLTSCGQKEPARLTQSGLDPVKFDTVVNGQAVKLYRLINSNGMEVCVTNFGARVISIMAEDRVGEFRDVVLAFDNIAQFMDIEHNASDFGAAIGRYANRINQGKITIGEDTIQLPQNNFSHCLHGGPLGWQYKIYEVDEEASNDSTIVMGLHSEDGDNNFPGNVEVKVTYTLTADNTLDMKFEAVTDKETVINMTNHSYFNLHGDPSAAGTDMVLYINADNYTPTDATFMTTGEVWPVAGSQFDFTVPKTIQSALADTTGVHGLQIKNAMGIDHNFCLNTYKDGQGDDTVVSASLYSPKTGIFMQVYTNEPGIQCYTGNFLNGKTIGKNAIAYPKQASVCLETQKYPDSPNKKDWVQPYLKPGEKYYSHVAYKFSVK